jgi:hypothetical protein
MNAKTKSNLIASIILALAPIGLFALALPIAELAAGLAIAATLIGLGVMDLNRVAYRSEAPRARKAARGFRLFKSHA